MSKRRHNDVAMSFWCNNDIIALCVYREQKVGSQEVGSNNIEMCTSGVGGHLLCGPYWGCAAPKGHFLSPDSLAKGVFFLANIP